MFKLAIINTIVLIIIISYNYNVIAFSSDNYNYLNNNNNNNTTNIQSDLYLCGGIDSDTYFSKCIKYNLETRVWRSIESMTSRRVWFQLVAYKSQLYAIGGFDGSDDTNSVENYVSDTNTWYPSLKSLNKIREAMGAAVIDNSIYVCGGFDTKPGEFQGQYLNDCEYYTTNTKQWYLSIPMLSRRAHLALVAQGSWLYALGGRDNGSELATGERYDTGSEQWQPIASMLTKRAEFGAVSYKDKLYVCGGSVAFGSYTNQCEAYDPVADKWTKIGSLSEKRKSLQLIVYNEKLYALGGYPLTNTVEIYDLEANEWQFSQPFPYKVQAFGATIL